MSKKNVFPVLIASILLIIALYQASAQRQPTTTKQSIDLLANAGWEEVGIGSASGGGISNNAGKSAWPSMAIDQFDNAFVSWNDDSSGVDQIYILRWNGFLWEEMGLNSASAGGISNTGEKSLAPAIAIQPYDSFVCIAWRDWVSGYAETYWKCWNGNDWWPDNIYDISNQEGQSLSFSSMVYTNSPSHPQPYITWNESDGNDQEIYVATINFQTGWYIIQPSGLSNNINDSWSPSIGMVGNFGPTYVAWHDHSHDENAAEIYIRNVNGDEVGSNSASVGGISNTPGQSSSASLTVSDDGQLFVAWEDNTNGNYEIYVRHWNGYQWSELGTGSASGGGISNNPGDSLRPRVALDPDGIPYVAWYDNSSGNYEIYARRWNGLTWEEVGYGSATGGGISNNAGASGYLDLAIDSNGIPYVAWDDDSNGNQEIYVRRYSGQSPPTPTNTPLPTLTLPSSQTPTLPTATATNISTITQTPPPNSTSTPTSNPSATSTPQPSTTSSPTNTPQPPVNKITLPLIMHQPTPTHTPTPTQTPLPTNTPTPVPTQPPLFVGLQARWDGEGFIRKEDYYDVGTHLIRNATEMTNPDVIKVYNQHWYAPNPRGWEDEEWNAYYRISNGIFQSTDGISDPDWKWGYWWLLPYPWDFENGQTVLIDGQKFTVTGPHSGYTAFGQHVYFWQFVNQKKFLIWDAGGNWRQYVHAGDAILRYDRQTRLLLYDDVKRTSYEDGDETNYTVQYISKLTSSNAYPASEQNVTVEDTALSTAQYQLKGKESSTALQKFARGL